MSGEGEAVTFSLPGYDITSRIGRGGFAVVYRATQRSLGRPVAIKVLMADLGTPSERRRFDREKSLLSRLGDHRNVVDVYDAGVSPEGRPYIVMRLYQRGSLQDAVRADGPLAAEDVARTVTGVASALDTAHAQQVVHRDVTPGNILLTDDGDPVLTDFGLASLADSVEGTTRVAFTPSHAAPEVIRGEAFSVASDVYSLASTARYLLAGPPPGRPVPAAVDAVLRRGLSADPAARFGSAGELAQALDEAIRTADRAPAAVSSTPPEPEPPEAKPPEFKPPEPEPPAPEPPAPEPPVNAPPGSDQVVTVLRGGPEPHRAVPKRARRRRVFVLPAIALAAVLAGIGVYGLHGGTGSTGSPGRAVETTVFRGAVRVEPVGYPHGDEIRISWSDLDRRTGVRNDLLVDGVRPAGCPEVPPQDGNCTTTIGFDQSAVVTLRTSAPGSRPVDVRASVTSRARPKLTVRPGKKYRSGGTRYCAIVVAVRGLEPEISYTFTIRWPEDSIHHHASLSTDDEGNISASDTGYGYRDPQGNAAIRVTVAGLSARRSPWACS